MLKQTTNKIQRLGFGHKKIDTIKHQLINNLERMRVCFQTPLKIKFL